MAVPFDVTRLEVTGAAVVVVEDVMQAEGGSDTILNFGAGQFSVSRSGALAHVLGGVYPPNEQPLVWVHPSGASEPLPLQPGAYSHPRFSPDGSRLAYLEGPGFGDFAIWVYDIQREVPVRLTSSGLKFAPVWSPDGARLAFTSEVDGTGGNLFVTASDGSGEPRRVTESDLRHWSSSWSSGDVAFVQFRPGGVDFDIMTVSMDGEREPEPFLASSFNEGWPAFSPDGRWLAYASDETGESDFLNSTTDEFEVYVRPFPQGEPAVRVSMDGGISPLWSPDGRQLFYRKELEDGTFSVMVADVETDPIFTGTRPRTLFEGPFGNSDAVRDYDVAPDGRRFVMVTDQNQAEAQPVTRINIVLNWVEELKRLVPPP